MSNNTRAVVELSRGADPLEVAKVGCLNGATLCNADIYGMGMFGLSMAGMSLRSAAQTGLPTGSNSWMPNSSGAEGLRGRRQTP